MYHSSPINKFRYLHFLIFLLTFFTFLSCSSTKKMISKGSFDEAIELLLEKIAKQASIEKIQELDQAYNLAYSEDLQSIHTLKSSGEPDIWESVFTLYSGLNSRQQKVFTLPRELLDQGNFTAVNYDVDMQVSREKAAGYYYALATKQLKDGGSENHPEAVGYLIKVNDIYPGFRDVEALIEKYKMIDPLFIYYQIENYYSNSLPPGVGNSIEEMDLSRFNTPEYRFQNSKPPKDLYKVFVQISITRIKISPERSGELAYTESAEIQDGVAYELDGEGDFVLNSLGEKIEIPRFKTLVCYANEYKQEKSIKIIGTVEVINRETGNSIGKKAIVGESKFVNLYAKFKGDLDALSPESFDLVGSKKQEYPDDALMIMDANEKLDQDAVNKVAAMLDNVVL